MTRNIFTLMALVVTKALSCLGDNIVIADFEGNTYGDWKVEGEAFGSAPAKACINPPNLIVGYQGKGLVNSFIRKDKTTGTLTSPEIKIQRKYINFLIGGGNHEGRTCMNLLVDGKVVRTAIGCARKDEGREVMRPAAWDVTEFAGRRAVLQIVDSYTGGWGHINIDYIVQSDQAFDPDSVLPLPKKVNGNLLLDYRSGKQPPTDWVVEGYAFGSFAPDENKWQKKAVASNNQRQYRYGKMISPEFEIAEDYIEVQCSGVCHPEFCTVRLVVDGKDVRGCSPSGKTLENKQSASGTFWFDVRELKGRTAKLEVRDKHFNGWLDKVFLVSTDRKPPAGASVVTSLTGWMPDCFKAVIKGDYLLLPVGEAKNSPLQEISIRIDGHEKLVTDFPLAFGDIPVKGYLPVYDLTAYQGKNLTLSYHSFTGREKAKFLLQHEIPGRETSDNSPAFHINCRIGKLNDPNGLCFLNGTYHLCHQFTYGIRAKSWAHYTSTDLMHWEERPTALFQDHLGSMHSGSAAVDVMNTSGWQTLRQDSGKEGGIPPIIAAFTGSRGMGGLDKIQMQGIAYSVDGGKTFSKYEGNPVVGADNVNVKESDNARDPKIFWFSPTRGRDAYAKDGYWVMVLYEGTSHSIYTSKNLKEWERHGGVEGFYECPELFPLAVDGDPRNVKWIMYGANGQYHIGSFDGKSFKPETENKIPMNIAAGRFYAAQIFNNTPLGVDGQPRRIQVAWQGDQISIATELTLRTTTLGLRICMLPVAEISNLYTSTEKFDGIRLEPGAANPLAKFKSGLYDIEIEADLFDAKQFEFSIRGNKLVVDTGKSTLSFYGKQVVLPNANKLVLRIVVDNTSTDIYVGEHGFFHIPCLVKQKNKTLVLATKGGTLTFGKLRVHELKSIW